MREVSAVTTGFLLSEERNKMLEVSNVFELWERKLWASMVKLSLIFGRICVPTIDVLSAIAAGGVSGQRGSATKTSAKATARGSKKPDATADLWPLCMPAIQHALTASMLLSSNKSADEDSMDVMDDNASSPEIIYICASFLNSLENTFAGNNLSQLSTGDASIAIHDDIPLSLRDARLFVAAVMKLQKAEQKTMLSRFIDILHRGLAISDKKSLKTTDESHLLARGITLCSSLVDVMSTPDLVSLLWTELESTNYSIPRLKLCPSRFGSESDQIPYNKRLFQSLFADWQSPSTPYSSGTTAILHEEDEYKKLESIFRSSMALGFQQSSLDGCHLLFSSWNVSAKSIAWTSTMWNGPSPASELKNLSSVDRILRLREDMCFIHDVICSATAPSSSPPKSLLLKAIQSKMLDSQRHKPNEVLLSGLNSAEKLLGYVASEIDKVQVSRSATSEDFVYYEALPLFTSFLISNHSRPGTNDFGSVQRFAQTAHQFLSTHSMPSTTESAPFSENVLEVDSDLEMENMTACDGGSISIVRRAALKRLHEACLSLGAAPCHPDYLSTASRLQDWIVPPIAVDAAERALSALTKFGVAVLKVYMRELQLTLGIFDKEMEMEQGGGKNIPSKYATALQLCFGHQVSEISESFYSHVSSVFRIDGALMKLMMDHLHSPDDQHSLSGSALVSASTQRIKGADISTTGKVSYHCQA